MMRFAVAPSRMKRNSTLDISTEGSLKVKRRMIVHTSQSLAHNEQIEEVSSSFHITVEEDTLSDVETTNEKVDEAPLALEDGVQAIVDELRAITSVFAKDSVYFTQKTYFFYFTLSLLQNTHISLSIIHTFLLK